MQRFLKKSTHCCIIVDADPLQRGLLRAGGGVCESNSHRARETRSGDSPDRSQDCRWLSFGPLAKDVEAPPRWL
jgi:hypothetical protein